MKKALSTLLAMVLSLSTFIALAGCSGNTNDQSSAQPAQGRYVEQKIEQPGGDITQLSDGTYRMLTFSEKEEKWVAMESKDGSLTWTPIEYPWSDELKTKSLKKVQFMDNGDVYILANDISYLFDGTEFPSSEDLTQEEIDAMSLVHPGEDELFLHGTKTELTLMDYKLSSGRQSGEGTSPDAFGNDPNYPFFAESFFVTDRNEILAFNSFNQTKQLERNTGKIIRTYSEPQTPANRSSMLVTDNILTMKGDNNLLLYNLETGKQEDTIKLEGIQEGSFNGNGGSLTSHFLAEDVDKDAYLYVAQTGVYRIMKDGSFTEKILDSEFTGFSELNSAIQGIYTNNDGSFLIQSEIYNQRTQRPSLFLYAYDSEASAIPTDTLSVYSLRENDAIREAIDTYKAQYPNSYATYTVGLDQDGIETEQDAFDALIQDLETDKGPDLILLDGLPVESLVKKDLLLDLNSTLQKAISGENLYKNVAQTYEQNGATYALPTQFQIPLLAGAGIENVNSLKSLSEWIVKQDPSYLGKTGLGILKEFHPIFSTKWFGENGRLEEDQLKDDFQNLKKINDALPEDALYQEKRQEEYEEEYGSIEEARFGAKQPTREEPPAENYFGWRSGHAGVFSTYGNFDTYLRTLRVAKEKEAENPSVQFFPSNDQSFFIPKTIVSISKNSEYKEGAENLINILITPPEEASFSTLGDLGFSTNKTTLKNQLQTMVDGYEEWGYPDPPEEPLEGWFAELWPGHEEMITFVDGFENLEATHPMDAAKYHIFEKGLKSYLREETSLDEAVATIKADLEV